MNVTRSAEGGYANMGVESDTVKQHEALTAEHDARAASADAAITEGLVPQFGSLSLRQSSLQREAFSILGDRSEITVFTNERRHGHNEFLFSQHAPKQSPPVDANRLQDYERFHVLSRQLAFKLTKLKLKYCHDFLCEVEATESMLHCCEAVKNQSKSWTRVINALNQNKDTFNQEMRAVIMLIQQNKTFKNKKWGCNEGGPSNPTDIPDPYEAHDADATEEALEELCYQFAELLKRLSRTEPSATGILRLHLTPPR